MMASIGSMPRIARGEEITAAFLNRLAEGIDAGRGGGASSGGEDLLRRAVMAAVAMLAPGGEGIVWCRIRHVRFRGDLLPDAAVTRATVGLPSEFTYDYFGIGRPGIEETNAAPVYGRPVVNDEALVHPALPGMACIVLRLPTGEVARPMGGELWLIEGSEVAARRRCGTAVGAPGGGGGPVIPPPPPPPEEGVGKGGGDSVAGGLGQGSLGGGLAGGGDVGGGFGGGVGGGVGGEEILPLS